MEYTNTVLIVDDSQMVLKMLGFMIKKAGYNILSADNGEGALAFFDGRDIDLVITDLNMLGMDGSLLINEIRRKEYYLYIPVVLFVADSEAGQKEIKEKAGATMLFDKKDIKEKIISTIKKMLG
ncbi:MAG: response regulator [Ferruginibacter sp.]